MLTQDFPDFTLKVRQQLIRRRKSVRPPRVITMTVPMVMLRISLPIPPNRRPHAMGVIKPHQPPAGRRMQRERIPQTMRTFPCWQHPLDLKLQPIALFEDVDASIKRQQIFERVIVRNLPPPSLSYPHRIIQCPNRTPAISPHQSHKAQHAPRAPPWSKADDQTSPASPPWKPRAPANSYPSPAPAW